MLSKDTTMGMSHATTLLAFRSACLHTSQAPRLLCDSRCACALQVWILLVAQWIMFAPTITLTGIGEEVRPTISPVRQPVASCSK